MLMSDSDQDPDCIMANDVGVISQNTSHQEDSPEDDMPAVKKVKSH